MKQNKMKWSMVIHKLTYINHKIKYNNNQAEIIKMILM